MRRGYACLFSDGGHTGSGGLWAYHNLQAELDFAIRGPHVTTLAGKAIVREYYGKAPHKSYFWGCSKGGKQALMEAQRFPWDYDGILAGDPSMGGGDIAMAFLWAVRALTDPEGKSLFETADLETLHQAVVAKCDLNDGVKDGLIGDPRACQFDPSTVQCASGKRPGCLTLPQIQAAKQMYAVPLSSEGVQIMTPVAVRGSELTWSGLPSGADRLADWFRYIAFRPPPGPAWQLTDFDFDRDFKRLGVTRGLHAPDNPDLRPFKAAGGKLLAYQGWNTVSPLSFVDYYETLERTMGGRAATQEFARFFALPGVNHCGGGEGAFAVDYLQALEGWVEEGRAPDRLVGAHVHADDTAEAYAIRFPLDPERIAFTRPLYPYPLQVKYSGRGNPRDERNFVSTEK